MAVEPLVIVSAVVGEELLIHNIPEGNPKFIVDSLARFSEAFVGLALIAGGEKLLGSMLILKLIYHSLAPNMKATKE